MTPLPKVDLTNCDREPIHLLAAIQSFGFLLALRSDWTIARTSANVAKFLGRPATAVLGQHVSSVFTADAVQALRDRIAFLRGPDAVERLFNVALASGRPSFDVAVHLSGSDVVVEAEPSSSDTSEAGNQVRTLISRLTRSDSMNGFLSEAARQVRTLTGFDRVKVYKFDDTGSGEVVAEALKPGVDSFLGLHYPASDIPAQARALYLRNIFRIIADVDDVPAPIVPTIDDRGEPFDQSLSILRVVSPIHIEYLRNMGVKASLSISIITEGRLWGLFACHHYAPLLPTFAQRSAAELYGQVFSFALESRERREASHYERNARGLSNQMLSAVAHDNSLLKRADWLGETIIKILPADGVGVSLGGSRSLAGLTPSDGQFVRMLQALSQTSEEDVFTTNRIASLVPDAEAYEHVAAGMLAMPLSKSAHDFVVLFRAEQLRTVRWAGNPEKPVELGPLGKRLTPRQSFAEWSELVKGTAVPFSLVELGVARSLRTSLLEVVLRLAEEAGQARDRANQQQQLLIAELNHRVRNILGLIRGLVSQSRNTKASTDEFIGTLESRIQALARAHDQITTQRWNASSLSELVKAEAGAYLAEKQSAVRIIGADVLIEPAAFTVLALVLHELITNAAKYGALSDRGHVELTLTKNGDNDLEITWTEVGGPPVTTPKRRGFGSTIIERSIPFELSGQAAVEYRLLGFRANFVLPSRFVFDSSKDERAEVAAPPSPPIEAEQLLAGKRVLLVEDSMLIALDAEDALRSLGATSVGVAPSLAAAEALLSTPVDVAILDFNLGRESSLPLAERLARDRVPMILATGYGGELELPAPLANVPVMSKPFTAADLAAAIRKVLPKAAGG